MTIQQLIDNLRASVAVIAEQRGVTMAEVLISTKVIIDLDGEDVVDDFTVNPVEDDTYGWVASIDLGL